MQVGEDKIVRLLKALLKGEPPPQEAAGDDDDDDDDDDEAYPVNETSTGGKQVAPPLKAAAPEAAEVVQVAELTTKLQSLSFSTAGKRGISNPTYPYPTPTPTPNPTPTPTQASSASPSRRTSSPR